MIAYEQLASRQCLMQYKIQLDNMLGQPDGNKING